MSGLRKVLGIGMVVLASLAFNEIALADLPSGLLRAGAAKVNIDPPADVLGNYSGVHDSVYVRTIVVDNGAHRAALVAMDLGQVPGGQDFLAAVAAATEIDPAYLFIAATHDHSSVRLPRDAAPSNENVYYDKVINATIKSITDSISSLQPARVGFAEGRAYVNTNRDEMIGAGAHMGYAPERASDKTVAVAVFQDMAGKPIAIYSNYAVHAVTMFRANTKNGAPEVTGDLPGFTNRYVENHFEGAVSVWTSGAAGDQNPLFMANYNQDHPDVYDTGPAGYAIVDVLSRRLGEEIVRLTRSIKNTRSDIQLWGSKFSITCPGQERKNPRQPGEPGGGYMAPAYVEMVDADPVTIPLSLLMLDDIALAGISGELFTEIGMNIKRESVFDRIMLVTVMSPPAGYIATDEAYLLPAEKTVTNRIKPGCAEPALVARFNKAMMEYAESR